MGYADSMIEAAANKMNSFLSGYMHQGVSLTSAKKTNQSLITNYDAYFEFLDEYHFVDSLLEIMVSTISDAITGNSFQVKIAKDHDLEAKVNKSMDAIQLRDQIVSDLRAMIWRGRHYYSLDLDKNRLYTVQDPTQFQVIQKFGRNVGYLLGDEVIKPHMGLGYWFRKDEEIRLDSNNLKSTLRENSKYAPYIVQYSTFTGRSLFKKQLLKLFECYILEYLLYMLGLRDTLRPDILGMRFEGSKKNIVQATQATEQIESLLNTASGLLGNLVDPVSYVNSLTYAMLNGIKVIPNVNNYSDIDDLKLPDVAGKRDKLNSELDNSRKVVLAGLGVPEEVYLGSGNRWEVMSRSDRYLTMTNDQLTAIIRLVKDYAMAIAIKEKKLINYSDIAFSIETSTFLANYSQKQKMQALSERLSDFERITSLHKTFMESDNIDKTAWKNYLKKQFMNIDEAMISVLRLDSQSSDIKGNINQATGRTLGVRRPGYGSQEI